MWSNINRFAVELPLAIRSLIIADPEQGDVPEAIGVYGAQIASLPMKAIAGTIEDARVNMVGLGAVAALIGLPIDAVVKVLTAQLGRKGPEALAAATWPIASQIPATQNQTTLPMKPRSPVPRSLWPVRISRSMASRPNGHKL